MRKTMILSLSLLMSVSMTGLAQTRISARSDVHHSHQPTDTKGDKGDKGDAATAKPSSAAIASFEKIKTLVGDWEARDGVAYGGKPIRASYKVVSGGTSLMETYYQVGADYIDMVTLYHLDGDTLMLTHFCDVNNQVRMRAEPAAGDANALNFSYLDATNLSVSNREVINKLQITFQDKDHFTQTWTWRITDKGKTYDEKAVYNFVRRK